MGQGSLAKSTRLRREGFITGRSLTPGIIGKTGEIGDTLGGVSGNFSPESQGRIGPPVSCLSATVPAAALGVPGPGRVTQSTPYTLPLSPPHQFRIQIPSNCFCSAQRRSHLGLCIVRALERKRTNRMGLRRVRDFFYDLGSWDHEDWPSP